MGDDTGSLLVQEHMCFAGRNAEVVPVALLVEIAARLSFRIELALSAAAAHLAHAHGRGRAHRTAFMGLGQSFQQIRCRRGSHDQAKSDAQNIASSQSLAVRSHGVPFPVFSAGALSWMRLSSTLKATGYVALQRLCQIRRPPETREACGVRRIPSLFFHSKAYGSCSENVEERFCLEARSVFGNLAA